MDEQQANITSQADLNPFERFLTLFTKVRPGEGIAVAVMFSHGFLVLGCYYLLRPLREALILSEGSAELRSYAAAFQAAVLLLIIPLYSWLFRKRGDSLMIQRTNIFFITNLVLFAVLGLMGMRFGFIFFIWVGVFSVMVIAQLWAFATDLFNVKAGQRLFAIIAVGGSLGAIAGASVSGMLIGAIGPYGIMIVASVILGLTIFVSQVAQKIIPDESRSIPTPESQQDEVKSWLGGFHVVFRSKYLIGIAILVVLLNLLMSNGDYILNQFVEAAVVDALGANANLDDQALWIGLFFSDFYYWINIAGFVIQLFFVSRIFIWVGVHTAILFLPLLLGAGFLIIGLIPVFILVQSILSAQKAIDYSLMNTTRHALFLPTSKSEKYEGKTTIDTFFTRFGDVFSALAIFTATTIGLSQTGFIGLNVTLAMVLLALAWFIGRYYRKQASSDAFNKAPTVNRIIPNAHWVGDGPFMHQIPFDAFIDTDAGDTLDVELFELPEWLRFDTRTQMLHCDQPPTFTVEISIVAIARDYDGLEVRSEFLLKREWVVI